MSSFKPEYIVVHTAAFRGRNCDRSLIDEWHRERGWNGIGYHYVIINDRHDNKEDGTVEVGRDLALAGAHAKGLNERSIGICCVGHGDYAPFTDAQTTSLVNLISELMDRFPAVTLNKIIGHRELNKLVVDGILDSQFRTSKTCPGTKVNMDDVRAQVRERRSFVETPAWQPSDFPRDEEIIHALEVLERSRGHFPNAGDSITEVLTHPEFIELRGAAARPGGGGGSGRPR